MVRCLLAHPADAPPELLDARFRAFAGVGLILVCLLTSRFSAPTAIRPGPRPPGRWPLARRRRSGSSAAATCCSSAAWVLAVDIALRWPAPTPLLGGLCARPCWPSRGALLPWAAACPRWSAWRRGWGPGARCCGAGRAAATSVLFGMEHLRFDPAYAWPDYSTRRFIARRVVARLLVMLSANLHLAGSLPPGSTGCCSGGSILRRAAGPARATSGTYIGRLLAWPSCTYVVQRRVTRSSRSAERPGPDGRGESG